MVPVLRYVILWLCLFCTPVWAGAWPREKGNVFASLSHWAARDQSQSYTALFAEWGVTQHLTLGVDAGRAVSGASKAVIFLRAPLHGFGGPAVAAEIGLGQIAGKAVFRPGLSFGHAIAGRKGKGWLAFDGVLELDIEDHDIDLKADITLGYTPPARDAAQDPRWSVMVQLQTGLVDVEDRLILLRDQGVTPDPSFLRIVPSVTYRVRDNIDLELGFFRSLTGSDEQGLKIGLWSRF